jgi:hypothetical protein
VAGENVQCTCIQDDGNFGIGKKLAQKSFQRFSSRKAGTDDKGGCVLYKDSWFGSRSRRKTVEEQFWKVGRQGFSDWEVGEKADISCSRPECAG